MEDETGSAKAYTKMVRATLADGTTIYIQAKAVVVKKTLLLLPPRFRRLLKRLRILPNPSQQLGKKPNRAEQVLNLALNLPMIQGKCWQCLWIVLLRLA